jgi:L-fucose mutarotase
LIPEDFKVIYTWIKGVVLLLKGIPEIISPDMMKALMEMGHSDEIVLADANFPAVTCAKRLIRSDGHQLTQLLKAVLKFFPLDKTVEHPVALMSVNSSEVAPVIWEEYRRIIQEYEPDFTEFEHIERFKYYERAKNAFGVIISGDTTFRANIILKKGVIRD